MDINNIKKILLSIFWILKHYIVFRIILYSKYNIKHLKILSFLQWHGGACYFTGIIDNKPVFIKTDSLQTGILNNEYTACSILNKENDKHFPKALLISKITNIDFIILERFSGTSLTTYLSREKGSLKQNQSIIVNQLIDIISILNKKKIVHRDIRPDNIQVIENGDNVQILLFDFAYCIDSLDWRKQKRFIEPDFLQYYLPLMASLGEDYKQDKYAWDDAYSILKICKQNLKYVIDKDLLNIRTLVGKTTYTINE